MKVGKQAMCVLYTSKCLLTSVNLTIYLSCIQIHLSGRSQWPRGLRRRSAAARLLGFWVRIPPEAWMSVVNVVSCQVEVSTSGWSLVQRSPTECGVSEFDRESPILRRPWSTGGCCAMINIYIYIYFWEGVRRFRQNLKWARGANKV